MAKAIQVRSVPDDVHRRLKVRAAAEGRSLSDLIRAELVEVAARPTIGEVAERVRKRDPVHIGESSADAIRAARGERRRGSR